MEMYIKSASLLLVAKFVFILVGSFVGGKCHVGHKVWKEFIWAYGGDEI